MKIIQVTDTHLEASTRNSFGVDTLGRLNACIEDINANHPDAELCVFSGDLSHSGSEKAYIALRDALKRLSLPYVLMLGNHDDRTVFRKVFPDSLIDEHGFVQSSLKTPVGTLLFLDTHEPGTHDGHYCYKRQQWLQTKLQENMREPVFVFMHHFPFDVNYGPVDYYGLVQREEFGQTLSKHANIRHLFMGHVHRPISGNWKGISFTSLRGTAHQIWLDFSAREDTIPCSLEPPAYVVAFLESDRVIVHFHDFLDNSPKYLYDPAMPENKQVVAL